MPFVTGADVQNAKNRLAPSFVATNLAVHQCSSAPPGSTQAWDVFNGSWLLFLNDDETSIWNNLSAGGRADLAEQYGKDLLAWQNQILTWKCPLLAPPVVPSPYQPPPLIGEAKNAAKPAADVLGALTLFAGVLLVGYVAVVYVPKFVPALKGSTT
jgi:hypothetical protein